MTTHPATRAYTFDAMATDCSDNASAYVASAPVRLSAFKRSIAYHGTWAKTTVAKAYGGSARRAAKAGATVVFAQVP